MKTTLVAGGLHMNKSYIRTTAGGYPGYEVYIDGVFVGWTAGGMREAKALAKEVETERAHAAAQPHAAHWVKGEYNPCPGIKKGKK